MKKIILVLLAGATLLGMASVFMPPTDIAARATEQTPSLNEQAVMHDPNVPTIGNPNGDVTIVEFFDYQCSYCRKMHPHLMRLTKEDSNVRIVLKDWIIYGQTSRLAAFLALAAKQQDKYAETHAALMEVGGRLDHAKIRAAAIKAGLDLDKVDADVKAHGSRYAALLDRNDGQADALGLRGTPGLLIGPFMVPGYLDYDQLTKVVAQARAQAQARTSQK